MVGQKKGLEAEWGGEVGVARNAGDTLQRRSRSPESGAAGRIHDNTAVKLGAFLPAAEDPRRKKPGRCLMASISVRFTVYYIVPAGWLCGGGGVEEASSAQLID